MEFKYKQAFLIYSDTYEQALFGPCVRWGPHLSGNFIQSYMQLPRASTKIEAPTTRIENVMFVLWTCYFFLILNGI